MKTLLYLFLAACCSGGYAQMLDLKHLDRLSEKTDQVVNITLDEGLIRLAGSFLKGGDKDLDDVRKILPGIRGIYVRSYEFEKDGAYDQGDLDQIDRQLTGWSKVLEVREGRKKEYTKILIKAGSREVGGIVMISAGPRELTVVNIAGMLTAEQLEKLGGHLGIPEIDIKTKKNSSGSGKKDDDE